MRSNLGSTFKLEVDMWPRDHLYTCTLENCPKMAKNVTQLPKMSGPIGSMIWKTQFWGQILKTSHCH